MELKEEIKGLKSKIQQQNEIIAKAEQFSCDMQ